MDPFTVTPPRLEELIHRLTPRQFQIVQLLAQGNGIGETATLLSIGRESVKSHVREMCKKLDVDNRIQAIVLFVIWRVNNDTPRDNSGHPKTI